MPLAPGKRGLCHRLGRGPRRRRRGDRPVPGWFSSKIHLAVDGRGLPMRTILTAGQAGDNPQLLPLLDGISINRPGPGRPRTRPDEVRADKAYAHPSTRNALRVKGIRFTCPERSDQIAHRATKGSHGHRPSTPTATGNATSSNAASAGSNNSATSPPATPNAPPTTAPNSPSPPSSSGSATIRRTRPWADRRVRPAGGGRRPAWWPERARGPAGW